MSSAALIVGQCWRRQLGHFEWAGVPIKRRLTEFRVTEDALLPVGTMLTAAHFTPGQYVDVQGAASTLCSCFDPKKLQELCLLCALRMTSRGIAADAPPERPALENRVGGDRAVMVLSLLRWAMLKPTAMHAMVPQASDDLVCSI